MSSISDYLELELLDHVLGVGAYAQPSGIWIGLSTADPLDDPGILLITLETLHIQIELLGNFFEFCLIQLIVDQKNLVMKIPEPALPVGRHGGNGRRFGILMVAQWKILKYQLHIGGVFLKHLLE